MSVNFALSLAALFVATSFSLSYFISQKFLVVLIGYFLVTNLYSLRLKSFLWLMFSVWPFYIPTESTWGLKQQTSQLHGGFFSFSILFFLGLAFAKRATELYPDKNSPDMIKGRAYKGTDFFMVCAQG